MNLFIVVTKGCSLIHTLLSHSLDLITNSYILVSYTFAHEFIHSCHIGSTKKFIYWSQIGLIINSAVLNICTGFRTKWYRRKWYTEKMVRTKWYRLNGIDKKTNNQSRPH